MREVKLFNIDIVPYENDFFKKYGFVTVERDIKKGECYPFHWHDYFECEIILEGIGEHRYNKQTQLIKKGNAYLLSYSDMHSLTALTDMKLFNIRFDENLLAKDITQLIALMNNTAECFFDGEEFDYLCERIKRMQKEDVSSGFYRHITGTIISEIIFLILKKTTQGHDIVPSSLVQQTVSYILRHFREHISLGEIARELSVTSKYLGTLFRENTNLSFNEYLNKTRLKYACSLLITSDMSVKEIAFSSGYTSAEYFLYVFKKDIKTTPVKYRQEYGGKM